MQLTVNLQANVNTRVEVAGSYALLLSTGAAPSIEMRMRAGPIELESIRTAARGLKARLMGQRFDAIELQAGVACTVELVVSDGVVDISTTDGANVNATITGPLPLPTAPNRGATNAAPVFGRSAGTDAASAASPAPVAVTSAGSVVAAADANRRTLIMRNTGPNPVAIGPAGMTWARRALVLAVDAHATITDGAALAWSGICDAAQTASVNVLEIKA